MQLYYFYIASAILIALGYMLFDVLNKREVPNLFAYATILFAFAALPFFGNWHLVLQSYLIAFAILGFGYFIYRIGQLGLGDVFEFAVLSLLLAPISAPLVSYGVAGVALPSVISLFLDTGIAAVIIVPAFYIVVAVKRFGSSITKGIGRRDLMKAAAIVLAYSVFAALLVQISYAKVLLFSLLALIILGSSLLLLFQRPVTEVMVEMVGFRGFTEGDIIAFNLMSRREVSSASRRVKSFGRLVTKDMISEMRRKRVSQKFPVYKRAVPFAVPIFFGTLMTIIAGNLLLVAILG